MQEIPILAYHRSVTAEGRGGRCKDARAASLFSGFCPFCHCAAHALRAVQEFRQELQYDTLAVCLRCGWWSFKADYPGDGEIEELHFSARAVLQTFSLSENDIGCEELAKHISRHPEFIGSINPRKLEELAAAIYRDVLGYKVEFVSYGRHDGGIDILCTKNDVGMKAIQIKRYNRPIDVSQIREFLGAMILDSQKAGIFLTTGTFRSGCHEAVRAADSLGIHIDLIHGRRLLEFIDVLASSETAEIRCPYWGTVGYGASARLRSPLNPEWIRTAPLYDGQDNRE